MISKYIFIFSFFWTLGAFSFSLSNGNDFIDGEYRVGNHSFDDWKKVQGNFISFSGEKKDKICFKKSLERQQNTVGHNSVLGASRSSNLHSDITIAFSPHENFKMDEVVEVEVLAYKDGKFKGKIRHDDVKKEKDFFLDTNDRKFFLAHFKLKRPRGNNYKKWKFIWKMKSFSGEVFYNVYDLLIFNRHGHYHFVDFKKAKFSYAGQNIVSDLIMNHHVTEKMKVEKTFEESKEKSKSKSENTSIGALKPVDDGIPDFKNYKECFRGKNKRNAIQVTEYILPGKGGYWVQSEFLKTTPVEKYKFDLCGISYLAKTKNHIELVKSHRFIDFDESLLGDDRALQDSLKELEIIDKKRIHVLNNMKEKK